ncbi:MAG: hypothetical protein AB1671_22235 [Thermodesulfobacteriota bacterium]|jgi:hypothetical protein
MRRVLLSRFVFGLGVMLPLLPAKGSAEFVIQFTDGRQVTVGQYVQEGETVKIYTSHGVIGFRKKDIRSIAEIDASRSMGTPLENQIGQSAAIAPNSRSDSLEKPQRENLRSRKIEGQETEPGKAADDIERMDEEYQSVTRRLNEVWEKHLRDVDSGASADILAQNRRELDELNLERHKLIKAARQASPDDLPTWAR